MFPDKCFFFKVQVANVEVYFGACQCEQMLEKTSTCSDKYTQTLMAALHKEWIFKKRQCDGMSYRDSAGFSSIGSWGPIWTLYLFLNLCTYKHEATQKGKWR